MQIIMMSICFHAPLMTQATFYSQLFIMAILLSLIYDLDKTSKLKVLMRLVGGFIRQAPTLGPSSLSRRMSLYRHREAPCGLFSYVSLCSHLVVQPNSNLYFYGPSIDAATNNCDRGSVFVL